MAKEGQDKTFGKELRNFLLEILKETQQEVRKSKNCIKELDRRVKTDYRRAVEDLDFLIKLLEEARGVIDSKLPSGLNVDGLLRVEKKRFRLTAPIQGYSALNTALTLLKNLRTNVARIGGGSRQDTIMRHWFSFFSIVDTYLSNFLGNDLIRRPVDQIISGFIRLINNVSAYPGRQRPPEAINNIIRLRNEILNLLDDLINNISRILNQIRGRGSRQLVSIGPSTRVDIRDLIYKGDESLISQLKKLTNIGRSLMEESVKNVKVALEEYKCMLREPVIKAEIRDKLLLMRKDLTDDFEAILVNIRDIIFSLVWQWVGPLRVNVSKAGAWEIPPEEIDRIRNFNNLPHNPRNPSRDPLARRLGRDNFEKIKKHLTNLAKAARSIQLALDGWAKWYNAFAYATVRPKHLITEVEFCNIIGLVDEAVGNVLNSLNEIYSFILSKYGGRKVKIRKIARKIGVEPAVKGIFKTFGREVIGERIKGFTSDIKNKWTNVTNFVRKAAYGELSAYEVIYGVSYGIYVIFKWLFSFVLFPYLLFVFFDSPFKKAFGLFFSTWYYILVLLFFFIGALWRRRGSPRGGEKFAIFLGFLIWFAIFLYLGKILCWWIKGNFILAFIFAGLIIFLILPLIFSLISHYANVKDLYRRFFLIFGRGMRDLFYWSPLIGIGIVLLIFLMWVSDPTPFVMTLFALVMGKGIVDLTTRFLKGKDPEPNTFGRFFMSFLLFIPIYSFIMQNNLFGKDPYSSLSAILTFLGLMIFIRTKTILASFGGSIIASFAVYPVAIAIGINPAVGFSFMIPSLPTPKTPGTLYYSLYRAIQGLKKPFEKLFEPLQIIFNPEAYLEKMFYGEVEAEEKVPVEIKREYRFLVDIDWETTELYKSGEVRAYIHVTNDHPYLSTAYRVYICKPICLDEFGNLVGLNEEKYKDFTYTLIYNDYDSGLTGLYANCKLEEPYGEAAPASSFTHPISYPLYPSSRGVILPYVKCSFPVVIMYAETSSSSLPIVIANKDYWSMFVESGPLSFLSDKIKNIVAYAQPSTLKIGISMGNQPRFSDEEEQRIVIKLTADPISPFGLITFTNLTLKLPKEIFVSGSYCYESSNPFTCVESDDSVICTLDANKIKTNNIKIPGVEIFNEDDNIFMMTSKESGLIFCDVKFDKTAMSSIQTFKVYNIYATATVITQAWFFSDKVKVWMR